MKTPVSMRLEHQKLHDDLSRASHEPGAIGEAGRLVARLLRSHARKEESFALPPLGLLGDLAKGRVEQYMAPAIGHAGWLKTHLDDMLAEHRAIAAALERLIAAAREAERFEYVDFAEKLIIHARIEEEVMYPAAILVGEYLRLKLPAGAPA
jgi:hypothetical protein